MIAFSTSILGLVLLIATGGIGGLLTRTIVQRFLGAKNVGLIGYALNFAVALGGGFLIFTFTKSPNITLGWALGGVATTVERIWCEKGSEIFALLSKRRHA